MKNLLPEEPAAAELLAVEASDGSLVRRFRGGSQNAATQLYSRYANRLGTLAETRRPRALARCVDSEDIVQSVFRRFFRGVRQGRYDVPAGDDLWKLLMVITLNKIRTLSAFHYAAKRDVRLTAGEDYLSQLPDAHQSQDAEFAFSQLVIDETLAHFSLPHRDIIGLRLEGHEVAEIAQKIGRPKRTVERILQEARRKLRLLLDEQRHHADEQPECAGD